MNLTDTASLYSEKEKHVESELSDKSKIGLMDIVYNSLLPFFVETFC